MLETCLGVLQIMIQDLIQTPRYLEPSRNYLDSNLDLYPDRDSLFPTADKERYRTPGITVLLLLEWLQ